MRVARVQQRVAHKHAFVVEVHDLRRLRRRRRVVEVGGEPSRALALVRKAHAAGRALDDTNRVREQHRVGLGAED